MLVMKTAYRKATLSLLPRQDVQPTTLFADQDQPDQVVLPDEETAVALVFRIFEQVSYAFILNANRPVRLGDKVRNPE